MACWATCTVASMGITGLLPLLRPVTKDMHVSELKGLVSLVPKVQPPEPGLPGILSRQRHGLGALIA